MLRTADDTRFWDRAARKYSASQIKDMGGYELTLERTASYLRASDVVAELGCGTGTTALRLSPRVTRIWATDVSSEMIAIARAKAASQGVRNTEFEVASADGNPGEEAAYDAVLAFNLLHLVPDRASVWMQVSRLLKPGGLFISKTPCLSEMNPLLRLAVPVMRFVGMAPQVAFFSASELGGEIVDAGFEVIERGRHGSFRKDARIFLVARKASNGAQA